MSVHTLGGARTAAAAAVAWAAGVAGADIIHDEAVHGDLSGDRLNPTGFVLGPGSSSIRASSVRGDIEYVRVTIPAGFVLAGVVLGEYVSVDPLSFIGVQAGPVFTEPAVGANVAALLGYTHFGHGAGNVGADVLPEIGTGFGAMGFVPPLAAGEYTFWIQQTGLNAATYRFDFVVQVPGPGPAWVLGALAVLGSRRVRRPGRARW